MALFSAPPAGAPLACGDQVIPVKLSFSMRRGGAFVLFFSLVPLNMLKRRKSHAAEALLKDRSFMPGHL